MRKYLVVLVFLAVLSPTVFAQVLSSAIPNDPGKWSIALIAARQSNISNISNLSQTTYGLSLGYGLIEELELDLSYENGSFDGIPGFEVSLASYAASLKYDFIQESEKIPVSVALGVSYALLAQNSNLSGASSGSNYSLGLLASKMVGVFIPYVDLLYSSTNLEGVSTDWELTLGNVWLFSEQAALAAENTWQFQPDGYTQGRSSVALAYSL